MRGLQGLQGERNIEPDTGRFGVNFTGKQHLRAASKRRTRRRMNDVELGAARSAGASGATLALTRSCLLAHGGIPGILAGLLLLSNANQQERVRSGMASHMRADFLPIDCLEPYASSKARLVSPLRQRNAGTQSRMYVVWYHGGGLHLVPALPYLPAPPGSDSGMAPSPSAGCCFGDWACGCEGHVPLGFRVRFGG